MSRKSRNPRNRNRGHAPNSRLSGDGDPFDPQALGPNGNGSGGRDLDDPFDASAFDRSSSHDPFDEPRGPDPSGQESYVTLQNVTFPRERALSRRQLLALPIVASASTLGQGASDADISRMTLYRWLQDDDFREEYNRVRSEIAELAMQEAKAGMLDGIITLRQCCRDPNGFVRSRAAHSLVALGYQQVHTEKLQEEIAELQKTLLEVTRRYDE